MDQGFKLFVQALARESARSEAFGRSSSYKKVTMLESAQAKGSEHDFNPKILNIGAEVLRSNINLRPETEECLQKLVLKMLIAMEFTANQTGSRRLKSFKHHFKKDIY